jgi:hypothetical protein
MPRHTRASSGTAAAANPYPTHASMAMYSHRMMPNSDYFAAMPAPPADPMQMPPQHHHSHHHQSSMSGRSFDNSSNTANAYTAHTAGTSGASVPAVMTPSSTHAMVSLPPSHRPSSGAWTPQDDQQLMTARAQGLNWSQIKEMYFPGKTANACRKRHERLAERRDADDWDNRKFQRLAKEYMTMRKEIWSGLAARTGEKWNVVEQKVLSKSFLPFLREAERREASEQQ